MKSLIKILSVGVMLAPFVAHATTVLPNGASVNPTAIGPLVITQTLATTGTVTMPSNCGATPGCTSTFSVSYTESVVKANGNPFGNGDLAFVMTFTNSAGSADAIEHATNGFLSGFKNFSADVDYVTGSGITPVSASENTFGTISFDFTGVSNGATSATLVIFTNASNFANGNFSLIDSQTATGLGYIPASPQSTMPSTPEPSSLILLGTGLMGAAGAAFRKRRAL